MVTKGKLACYFPINDPLISLDFLKSYSDAKVDFIELGLKDIDPYLDGDVIQDSMQRSYGFGNVCEALETIKAVDALEHVPHKVLFLYANKRHLKSDKNWRNIDSIFCPGHIGSIRKKILDRAHKQKVMNVEFLEYYFNETDLKRARCATSYIMLQYSKGKTGLRKSIDKDVRKRIIKLKRNGVILPIFLGIGISSRDQIKHALDCGADGVVIGSGAVSAALKGKNCLTDYLCGVREAVNGL